MNVEPKLRNLSPAQWVGGVTLSPEEAQQIAQLLPEGALKDALRATLARAVARAQELNDLDRSSLPERADTFGQRPF